MTELEEEGGIEKRYQRYVDKHTTLVNDMNELGFSCLLLEKLQSPIITSFNNPHSDFNRISEVLSIRKNKF